MGSNGDGDLSPQSLEPTRGRPGRPPFTSQKTSDRMREGDRRPSSLSMPRMKPLRRSIFKEEGLDDLDRSVHHEIYEELLGNESLQHARAKTTFDEILSDSGHEQNIDAGTKKKSATWYTKIAKQNRPTIESSATAPPGSFATIPRAALIVFLIAVVIPGLRYGGNQEKINISGADAGVIRTAELVDNASTIDGRADSPTSICTRWANQVANVNGTVFIYGGRATTTSGQTSDTWNNDFLKLDLTKSWDIASPPLTGLPQPSGPPAVALGSLWHSYDSLFLYGGEFSDTPATSPSPVSLWQYNIQFETWTEYTDPQTSNGNASDGGGTAVQRAAEGAGLSVPELGRSWYFGGHLDLYTTPGWSNQVARVYLKSMLEFTHPGYANTGVYDLGSSKAAPAEGTYRNITEGGLQDTAGFTERADGVLVYVPGWGEQGILLGLAGGTNATFTEMNIIDVYDVANSTWYKQSTSGTTPPIRVNPCAVVAAAPDGTSFNIYLYGGQNLIPYDEQIQYSDMWILTIPSFTWIQVDLDGQSSPPARAGHSCTLWDGQMVVIGGYVGTNISCDPGFYVFNASSLQWTTSFTSITAGSSSGSDSSGGGADQGSSVIQGSLGYQVPAPVQSIIGGNSMGGATATQPAAGSATAGPIATGKPPTFTVTQSASIVTQTSSPTGSSSTPASTKHSTNVGAIAAGVVAGVLAMLATYLAFCAWLYRRQLNLYKNHVAMAQRTAFTNSPEDAPWASETPSGNESGSGTGRRPTEKVGGGVVLGPFGTKISSEANSVGRQSEGGSSASGQPMFPGAALTSSEHGSVGGAAAAAAAPAFGIGRYSRVSEGDENIEYLGAGGDGRLTDWARQNGLGTTAHSSMEDLLGNAEPSFFSVVLNPRRTLRVVNSD